MFTTPPELDPEEVAPDVPDPEVPEFVEPVFDSPEELGDVVCAESCAAVVNASAKIADLNIDSLNT